MTTALIARAPEVVADARRRTKILIGVSLALIAVVASVSGLNVAQQAIAVDLGASQSQILWVINGYTVALAALLMPIGAIGDRWGRKPVLLAGLGLFVVTNVLSAFSGSVEMLIGLRVLAGASAAMIMPATLSIITSSFPPESRGTAVGVWSGFAGAGGILGLFASSLLIDSVTWPWLFVPPVAIALVAAVVVHISAPNSREHTHARFDRAGSFLAAVAVGGIVLGIHEGPERGWSDPLTLAGLVLGLAALVAFIRTELRADAPLLDVRVFRSPVLSAGSLGLAVFFAAMLGVFLVLIQFLTAVLGFSAIKAAAGLLPLAAVMMTLSPIAPKIAQRIGVRAALAGGLAIAAVGLVLMALGAPQETYAAIVPGLVVVGLGVGLAMTPATTAITGALPPERQGVASALNDTVREVGGAIGVALLGSMLNSGYRASISDAAASLDPSSAHQVEEGIAGAGQVASRLGQDGVALFAQAKDAFTDGWVLSMWIAAAMAATAALVVAVMMRRPRPEQAEAPQYIETRELVAVGD